MCRHIAYIGPETAIRDVVIAPEHSLFRQSWAPRHQRHGTVNADGFGIGWYAEGDPAPARYRRPVPIWADPGVEDLTRVVATTALLAAVRDATLPTADGEAAAQPFAAGPWLFSHNGAILGWPDSAAPLIPDLPADDLLRLEARTDSAFAWALVLHRLRRGDAPARALTETALALAEAAPGSRLNFLLHDGTTVTAITWGDTLHYRTRPTAVASEPYDDDPAWAEVPDRTLLTATRTEVLLNPIKEPTT
ncbi:ergothioneine biosynthesis protein EgtC [Streptomyces pathocidini]|uniref:ergothioneine biosynthesis protein EgtC n=1 Tax=Streptomyces pathocidini TaxID=1650571 RepID=UPI0033DF488B